MFLKAEMKKSRNNLIKSDNMIEISKLFSILKKVSPSIKINKNKKILIKYHL